MFDGLQKGHSVVKHEVFIQISQTKHSLPLGNSHCLVLVTIDLITSNHWCYPSLAQNGFVINSSSS